MTASAYAVKTDMGKLIVIVGNSGSGKTTLAKKLGEAGGLPVFLEQHIERPFQSAFAKDRHFALANQIDYLLYRAEQERAIRALPGVGIQDGGLDLDFFVFTHLFRQRGFLSQEEFELCSRLHTSLRALLPSPELVIFLRAPLEVLAFRKTNRKRALDISVTADLETMDGLLQNWLNTLSSHVLLPLDSDETLLGGESLGILLDRIVSDGNV